MRMMNEARSRGLKVGDTVRIRHAIGYKCYHRRHAKILKIKTLIGTACAVYFRYTGGTRIHSVNSVMVEKI